MYYRECNNCRSSCRVDYLLFVGVRDWLMLMLEFRFIGQTAGRLAGLLMLRAYNWRHRLCFPCSRNPFHVNLKPTSMDGWIDRYVAVDRSSSVDGITLKQRQIHGKLRGLRRRLMTWNK